ADLQGGGVQDLIEACAGHQDLSVDLRAAQTHRIHKSGAAQDELSRDPRAAETHRVLENGPIAQIQIAFGMQTVRQKFTAHQRVIELDQTVGPRAGQIDFAFNAAAVDYNCPNEARICEIESPDDPGASNADAPQGRRLPPR